MTTLSKAIKAKQSAIQELQADIDALHRAASIIGGKTAATPKKKHRKMSAAQRKAVGRRMKAYWAKRKGKK